MTEFERHIREGVPKGVQEALNRFVAENRSTAYGADEVSPPFDGFMVVWNKNRPQGKSTFNWETWVWKP